LRRGLRPRDDRKTIMIAIIGNVLAGLGVVALFGATVRLTKR
jgi:hypothetical protein